MELTPMNNMNDLTRAELLSQCEQLHLTKYKSKTKPELIELLSSHISTEHNDGANENANENENANANIQQSQEKKYCNVIKKVKKENITKDNISEIMLCQIPGVSSQTAYAICDKFKNIKQLIQNIELDKNCLNDICTVDDKQKPRKISKTTIKNILLFLSE